MTSKSDFRAAARVYRAQLTPAAYQQYSAALCAALGGVPEFAQARVIHAFWPMVHRREIDIRPLIRAWHAAGKTVALPVMHGLDGALTHHAYTGEAALQANAWGIQEPQGTPQVDLEAIDAVLVPALALDRAGHRLGYGRGHYDRFLGQTRAFKVGVVYAACLLEALPVEVHDVPLDCMVTEEKVWRVARGVE